MRPVHGRLKGLLKDLWAFSRPHTILGTSLSVMALSVLALELPSAAVAAGLPGSGLPAFGTILAMTILALLPALAANVYIVGLNQITDIAIDRINKPHLPLASGRLSSADGRRIVAGMGLAAVILASLQGGILLATVTLSMLIGTIYSLPPIRLKRHPFWAATCIYAVRGIVVNLGFFLHFRRLFHPTTAGGPLQANPAWLGEIPAEIWALTGFVILFSIGIALLKDVPDLEGDRQHQIRTLTVRLGPDAVMRRSRRLLAGCYLLMVGLTLAGLLPNVRPTLLVVSQLAILALMWWRSSRTDPRDRAEVSRFYQFIWRLFFLQYLLVPLACLPRS